MSTRTSVLVSIALLSLNTFSMEVCAQSVSQVSIEASSSVVLTLTTASTMFYGQSVDGYAQVSASDSNVLSGTITFYDGSANICVIPVTQTRSCPSSAGAGFEVGNHSVTAVYSGDSAHLGSTSNAVNVLVEPDITTASVASTPHSVTYGQSVAFTAIVSGNDAIPTGSVAFLDGTAILGSAVLDTNGAAVFSTSSLSVGTHAITASYSGTAQFGSSTSAALDQVETMAPQPASGSFTISVGAVSVATGKTASVAVTVTPVGGFNQAVQLACSDLPTEATCTFAASVIPAGGGTTSLQLSTLSPAPCGSSIPYNQSAAVPFGVPLLAGLAMLFLPRRRRRLKSLLGLMAVFGFVGLSGCGACTNLGTRPGTYTMQVTGVSVGTMQVTSSQKVQVMVGD